MTKNNLNPKKEADENKNNRKDNNNPYVYFNNCSTIGDKIEALTSYFIKFDTLNTYILEQSLKKVEEINKRIKEYKKKVIENTF